MSKTNGHLVDEYWKLKKEIDTLEEKLLAVKEKLVDEVEDSDNKMIEGFDAVAKLIDVHKLDIGIVALKNNTEEKDFLACVSPKIGEIKKRLGESFLKKHGQEEIGQRLDVREIKH